LKQTSSQAKVVLYHSLHTGSDLPHICIFYSYHLQVVQTSVRFWSDVSWMYNHHIGGSTGWGSG